MILVLLVVVVSFAVPQAKESLYSQRMLQSCTSGHAVMRLCATLAWLVAIERLCRVNRLPLMT